MLLLVSSNLLAIPDHAFRTPTSMSAIARKWASITTRQGGSPDTARQVRHTALTALPLTGFEGAALDGRMLGIANMMIATGSKRPTYIVTPQASITIRSKSSLLPDQAIEAVKLAHALDKAPKNLRHVPRAVGTIP